MKTNITKTFAFLMLAFLPLLTKAQHLNAYKNAKAITCNANYVYKNGNTLTIVLAQLKSNLPASSNTTESHGIKRIEMRIDKVSESIARSIRFYPMDVQAADKLANSEKELEAFTLYIEQSLKYKPSESL